MSAKETITIVGNGEIAAEAADIIDASNLIVRFNDCRSFGNGGSRTDVVAVCNTGRPAKAMLGSQQWRSHPAVSEASAIWSVRDPRKFAVLKTELAISHPELDDLCDDYTDGFVSLCADFGMEHRIIDQSIHEAVDRALAAYDPAPYVVPSSGMIVIAEVLARYPDADIRLAGFGHAGWEWHPFAAERRLVDAHIAAGRLKRIADHPFISPS